MPTRFNTPVSPRGDAPLALGFGGSAGSEGPIAYTARGDRQQHRPFLRRQHRDGPHYARLRSLGGHCWHLQGSCGRGALLARGSFDRAHSPRHHRALRFVGHGGSHGFSPRRMHHRPRFPQCIRAFMAVAPLLPPGHLLKKAHGPCGKFPIFLLSLHPIYPNIQHVKRR